MRSTALAKEKETSVQLLHFITLSQLSRVHRQAVNFM